MPDVLTDALESYAEFPKDDKFEHAGDKNRKEAADKFDKSIGYKNQAKAFYCLYTLDELEKLKITNNPEFKEVQKFFDIIQVKMNDKADLDQVINVLSSRDESVKRFKSDALSESIGKKIDSFIEQAQERAKVYEVAQYGVDEHKKSVADTKETTDKVKAGLDSIMYKDIASIIKNSGDNQIQKITENIADKSIMKYIIENNKNGEFHAKLIKETCNGLSPQEIAGIIHAGGKEVIAKLVKASSNEEIVDLIGANNDQGIADLIKSKAKDDPKFVADLIKDAKDKDIAELIKEKAQNDGNFIAKLVRNSDDKYIISLINSGSEQELKDAIKDGKVEHAIGLFRDKEDSEIVGLIQGLIGNNKNRVVARLIENQKPEEIAKLVEGSSDKEIANLVKMSDNSGNQSSDASANRVDSGTSQQQNIRQYDNEKIANLVKMSNNEKIANLVGCDHRKIADFIVNKEEKIIADCIKGKEGEIYKKFVEEGKWDQIVNILKENNNLAADLVKTAKNEDMLKIISEVEDKTLGEIINKDQVEKLVDLSNTSGEEEIGKKVKSYIKDKQDEAEKLLNEDKNDKAVENLLEGDKYKEIANLIK